MRPVKLEMQAFMPYAAKQVVDFRLLGHHTMMMIAGETGSGKTAVLDAMTYALFGSSTGGARVEATYRSHHATDETPTYVDFMFSVQGRLYRAARWPSQPARKTGRFELWSLKTSEDLEGTLLASGKTKVTDKVVSILGYNLPQFRSVVILPQGKFRDFLAAKTDKKADILSALFDTKRYRLLQDALHTHFQRLRAEQADRQKLITGIMERVGAQDQDQLTLRIEELQRESASIELTVREAAQKTQAQVRQHQEFTTLADAFRGLDAAREALTTLDDRRSERATREHQLKQAQRAAELAPVEEAVRTRTTDLDEATRRAEAAQNTLTECRDALRTASTRLTQAEEKQQERDQLAARIVELDGLRTRAESLTGLSDNLARLTRETDELKARLESKQRALVDCTQTIDDVAERLSAARESAARLDGAKSQHRRRDEDRQRGLRLLTLNDEIESAQGALETIRGQGEALVSSLDAAKIEFRQILQQHLSEYAARLADGLTADSPCPVCGSLEHPNPATGDRDDVNEAMVEKARQAVQAAEQSVAVNGRREREAEMALNPLVAELTQLKTSLAHLDDTSLAQLEASFQSAETFLRDCQRAANLVPELETGLAQTGRRKTELQAETDALAQDSLRKESERVAAQAALTAEERHLPEGLRTTSAIDTALEATRDAASLLEESLRQARADAVTAREKAASAQSELDASQLALTQARQRFEASASLFASRLDEALFVDETTYQAAKKTSEERVAIADWIKEYDGEVNVIRGRIGQLTSATAERERPDLDASHEALNACQEAEASVRATLEELRGVLSPLTEARRSVEALRADQAANEAQFGIVATLGQTAQGKNGHNLKFERYVLASLLDEVLEYANIRLHSMSSGRYRLTRPDLDTSTLDKRSQAGLDLDVADAFTGSTRSARTLSGGEGFQASLALALGLADVIQSQAGGIELSAMFIDEGFGTQSAEALDCVLDTLVSLQSSGRLVGFISHVEALKDRIHARLVVHKTPTGSRAAFVVAH